MKDLIKYKKKIVYGLFQLLLLMIFSNGLSATHNRAGEISFIQTGPLTIEVTLTTYTKTSSIAADRDSVEIFWGDGTSEFAVRANGWGDPQPNDVKINYYIASHTYPARASYTISMYDPNRVGGILNVNYPDSESVPFFLETTFTFLNTQFQGENNSAVLLQAPIDFGCVGEVFIHNPNAYDTDGDSIAYKLIIPLQAKNAVVPDYIFPDQISPGANNILTLDPLTGDMIWDSPQLPGEYNVAIVIEEYRNGVIINSMIRDMQIFILDDCENSPPTLKVDEELCVFAGDTVQVKIEVDDPNNGQLVRLEASGAPFISTKNLAILTPESDFKDVKYNTEFSWVTSCEDISDQYYQIIFKAMDNGISDTSGLATLKSLKVKVMGPAPEDLGISLFDNHVRLNWSYPYPCTFSDNDYFIGFSIWRSNQSIDLAIDTCDTGLEGSGYQKIVFLHDLNNGIEYIYEDLDVEEGENYCYRVVPEFAKFSFDGFPYNQVSGKPSEEVCISLPLNLPYIVKNSVDSTDAISGSIDFAWRFFNPALFDTLTYPGPYKVKVLRSVDNLTYELIPDFSTSFGSPLTVGAINYVDQDLNTIDNKYFYILDMYSGEDEILVGTSKKASSIFLKLAPGDQTAALDFEVDVPWKNQKYFIYRKGPGENNYQRIDSIQSTVYIDTGLINGEEYCYLVESKGFYFFNTDYIISNYSQKVCTTPNDITPPCTPSLALINPCDTLEENMDNLVLENLLKWEFDPEICQIPDDLAGFTIYFSPDTTITPLERIITIDDIGVDTFRHSGEFGLKGCYAISAFDKNENESQISKVLCAENCPMYLLPNVFTPNNDGTNDTFHPRIVRHIFSVDMKIYNQWGQLVFETNDPLINWDGTNTRGKLLAEGTYHYICKINGQSNGILSDQILSGYVQLIIGK